MLFINVPLKFEAAIEACEAAAESSWATIFPRSRHDGMLWSALILIKIDLYIIFGIWCIGVVDNLGVTSELIDERSFAAISLGLI